MLEACITNLGKYNEGELDYARVTFPTDSESLAQAFADIGVDFQNYEEFFISDYDYTDCPSLHEVLGEYENLDELNYLATKLEELSPYGMEIFGEVIQMEGQELSDLINIADNIDCYDLHSGIHTEADLGRFYVEEAGIYDLESMGILANYIDYEAFGRDIAIESEGEFTYGGYIEKVDEPNNTYSIEDIPDDCRIMGEAMHIVQDKLAMKNTELDTEDGYSFIDGVRNNLKPEKDEAKGTPSIKEGLKLGKESIAQQDKETPKLDKPKSLGGDER